MVRVAKRISETAKKDFGMYEKALELAASGRDLIHLEVGKPYADTPDHIKEATIASLKAGNVHYSELNGSTKLRRAIAEKLKSQNRLAVTPDEVIITSGLTHGSFAAFMALLDPGDEAILLEPYYPQHIGKIELAGAKAVMAKLDAAKGFAIERSLVAAAITPKTRMIVLINPVNPTGRVYRRAELQVLADLAIERDLVVVSDEVYEDIVFDQNRHISIASLPGMKERTVSLFAFTKSYAMDGWRLGYLAADAALIPGLLKITVNDVAHVNTFIQDGAHAAVTGPKKVLESLVAEDRRKRDMVVQRLNQMPGVTCPLPEGTIYAFPSVKELEIPSQELALRILEEANVVVEAGSFYGPAGEGHLRICFGSESYARLEEGMRRLGEFFNKL